MERRRSIRTRLLLLALLPLGIVLPVLVAVLAMEGGEYFDRLLVTKVRSDLAVAHGYYERVAEGVGRSVEALAVSNRLARTLAAGKGKDGEALRDLLANARETRRLDFLSLLDVEGQVRISANRQGQGLALGEWAVVRRALAGRASTETDVFSAATLARLDPGLAAQASTPLIATRNALPDQRTSEDRGWSSRRRPR